MPQNTKIRRYNSHEYFYPAKLELTRFRRLFWRYIESKSSETEILEGSLDRLLFAAELEFPKTLVPRLPQHTSNVNIECAGKSEWSKQLYSLAICDQLIGALIQLNFIILIFICF